MNSEQKNNLLLSLAQLLALHRARIMEANEADMHAFPGMDESMKDRLRVDDKKIDGMIRSLEEVASLPDPEGKILYEFIREDKLRVVNQTVPFGTILIIYESRPDVTIEAAATAFKAGNHILLKGGKEARQTNLLLTALWQQALTEQNIKTDYIQYLDLSREEDRKSTRLNSSHL